MSAAQEHSERAQKAAGQRLPAWIYLLCGFALLIIVQGALRKWVLPGYSTPLYIAKDLVLLGGFGLFLGRCGFRLPTAAKKTALPLIWGGLALIVCVQAFNLRIPSAAVGILGVRNYLLYSVLLVMVPMALQYVQRHRRLVTIVGIAVIAPVLILGFYQYTMPVDHWINRYVAVGAPVAKVEGDPRITGTFSYIGGMGSFLVFSLAFGTAVFVAGIRRGDRWYQIVGPPLFALALVVAPMNGSRSVVFGFFLAVPFVLYRAFQQGRRSALVLGISALLLVGGYVGTQSQWATRGWAAFEQRVETASDQGTRIQSMLWDPIEKVHIVFGYGAGSTHPGATALSAEGRVYPEGISYEEELGRAIVELGLVGGVIFLVLKLWVLWMTWDAMKRARTSWEDILCMTAFIVAFLHLIVEKIVFNHIGGSIYWLCAGAALWVWCRRAPLPTDVDSSRFEGSAP
jgi:hypothetical protein